MPPYKKWASKKQAAWGHSATGRRELGASDVKGKDRATDFSRLPVRSLAKHHSSSKR